MFLFWLSKVRVAQQFVIQKHLTQNLWCIGIIISIFNNKLQTILAKFKILLKNQDLNYKRSNYPFIK
jgi:hypothetical protein